ncbi:Phosphatidylinositol/phosphatidylcholine transfer protein SFH11 [Linum perenne]
MGMGSQDAIDQLGSLMDQVDEPLKRTYQNVHQGYQVETLARFLRARDWNVPKAHKMLIDSLHWRVQNEIDSILAKPIVPADLYRSVRDSQLIGMSGYSREGLPVFAMGVGLSTFDKASVHYYVQSHIQLNEYRDRVILPSASKKYGRPITTCIKVLDMTGLKLSALNQIKVVKPLLQERTRKKVQVLHGNGRDELLKIMDISSLPHFCKREGSGSSKHLDKSSESCYSLDHPFHQQLYNHIKQQASINASTALIKQGSFHVNVPESAAEGNEIAKNIESEIHRRENGIPRGLSGSLDDLKIKDDSE